MSAVNLDISLFDGRAFELNVSWYDDAGDVIDVTDYGAALVVKKENSRQAETLLLATSGDGITIYPEYFAILVPPEKTANLGIKNGFYEFVVWPTLASPAVNPVQLLYGAAFYHKTMLDMKDL